MVEKDLRDRVLKGGAVEENVWENKIGVMDTTSCSLMLLRLPDPPPLPDILLSSIEETALDG
jgi:hypothetical protein